MKMNTLFKSIARGTIVGLTLLGASVALADPPAWSNSRWNRGWDHDRHDEDRYDHGGSEHRYDHDDHGYRGRIDEFDYARVVDVDPIVRRVVVSSPQRDCWYEEQQGYGAPSSHTPAVLGAIIGGVIGHQFDNGHSRHNIGTVAGALLGGSVGYDAARRDSGYQTRSVERCAVNSRQDWEDRIEGYKVTYVYRGRQYCTTMPYNPGSRVQVRVGVDVDVVR
jgi:uncharacterized protein YcfJ